MTSASLGADAHAGDESVTGGGALYEGLRRKKALWRPAGRNQLESLKLARWASRRRQDLPTCSTNSPRRSKKWRSARWRAADDATWSWAVDGTGLRVGDRSLRNVFTAANRLPATWVWFRRKSPAAIAADWDTSASRATYCSGFCWWFSALPCDEDEHHNLLQRRNPVRVRDMGEQNPLHLAVG